MLELNMENWKSVLLMILLKRWLKGQFVYEDAKAKYAHRDDLKSKTLKTIGIGLAVTYYDGYDSNGNVRCK